MPTVYYSRWILCDDGTILENGAIAVEGRRIHAVGPRGKVRRRPGDRAVNLGATLVLPGMINAHTHLEEMVLRGIPRAVDETFASHIVKKDARLRLVGRDRMRTAVRLGVRELLARGTTTVVDSSRLGISRQVLEEEPIRAWVHHEAHANNLAEQQSALESLERCSASDSEHIRVAVGPYALFSLPPRHHRRTIQLARERGYVWACHIAESAEELQAFSEQSGDLYFHITRRQEWPYGNNASGPMYYAITNSLIPTNALCFHCNYVNGHEFVLLAARQATVVVCPRYTEEQRHKPFPLGLALSRGLRVCVATESVADTSSLSLFDELYFLRHRYPHIPARQMLRWVTQNPAAALGVGHELGSLTAGKYADMIAVKFAHDPRQDLLEELLIEDPKVCFVMVGGEEVVVGG